VVVFVQKMVQQFGNREGDGVEQAHDHPDDGCHAGGEFDLSGAGEYGGGDDFAKEKDQCDRKNDSYVAGNNLI